jgi:hypothetical protein
LEQFVLPTEPCVHSLCVKVTSVFGIIEYVQHRIPRPDCLYRGIMYRPFSLP